MDFDKCIHSCNSYHWAYRAVPSPQKVSSCSFLVNFSLLAPKPRQWLMWFLSLNIKFTLLELHINVITQYIYSFVSDFFYLAYFSDSPICVKWISNFFSFLLLTSIHCMNLSLQLKKYFFLMSSWHWFFVGGILWHNSES